ncbi:MAG: sporulation protein YtxC [Clostridia bacterium]|jgi:hypothetical protein|nr:putative sporulation protein YtxC [Clostridia bacterium]
MWELTIEAESGDTECLEFLQHKLTAHFKDINGVFAHYAEADKYYILLACKREYKVSTKKLVDSTIADFLINFYKRTYFIKNLTLPIPNEIDMQAFIKALTTFDSTADKDFILSKLKYKNKLIIKSFYEFRLYELKTRWDELCGLANSNSYYLLNKDTFNELLRFLISNLESKYGEVHILYDEQGYTICDYYLKQLKNDFAEPTSGQNDILLLTALIEIAPQKIVLHCDVNQNIQILKEIYNIFEGRVQLAENRIF